MNDAKISKSNKIIIIVSVIFIFVAVFAYYFSNIIEPERKYKLGIEMFESGNYADAENIFIEMIDYKESKQILNTLYFKVGQLEIIKGNYFEAISVLEKVEPSILVVEKISEINFLIGQHEFSEGNIDKAIEFLQVAWSYPKSRELLGEIFYTRAEEALLREDYSNAIANFEKVDYYKDSIERVKEIRYILGNKYLSEKDYKSAINEFLTIVEYKDAKRKLTIIDAVQFRTAKVGDSVYWGNYEQDYNSDNGMERIEWIVIEKNKDRLLVLSKYGLEALPYNTELELTFWENSYIREWLKDEFYINAFNEYEKEVILLTYVDNSDNSENNTYGGRSTNDYLFLLSFAEAKRLLDDKNTRNMEPTKYVLEKWKEKGLDGGMGTGQLHSWWTRTPGYSNYYALYVTGDDFWFGLNGHHILFDGHSVRPAMYIDLNTELIKGK